MTEEEALLRLLKGMLRRLDMIEALLKTQSEIALEMSNVIEIHDDSIQSLKTQVRELSETTLRAN